MTDDAGRLRRLGVISATVAVAVWGTSSVFIKDVDQVTGLGIAFYRLLIGAGALTFVHLLRGGRITIRFLRLCAAGGLAFALDITLFFIAVQQTSVTNATVIGALQPVLIMAIAPRLFGEHPRLSDVVLGTVAIGGCAIVVAGGNAGGGSSLRGDVIAVGALLAWTWYFVASKRARRHLGSFEYLVGLSIVAVAAMLPVVAIGRDQLGSPTARDWTIILFLTLVNGSLGHILMNWAHAHVPLVVTSLLTLAIPVFAATAAWLIIDESIVAVQVAGTAIVLGSLAVVVLHQARSPATAPEPPVGAGPGALAPK